MVGTNGEGTRGTMRAANAAGATPGFSGCPDVEGLLGSARRARGASRRIVLRMPTTTRPAEAAPDEAKAIARATGLNMHIATQFGFDARSLVQFETGLMARGITLPIHAGVAGPTPFTKLLKYAAFCGVGASLKAVAGNTNIFSKLPHFVTRSDEMVIGVYRAKQANPDSRIFAPHFFAFGGVLETARWLRAVIEGHFELDSAERGFSIKT